MGDEVDMLVFGLAACRGVVIVVKVVSVVENNDSDSDNSNFISYSTRYKTL